MRSICIFLSHVAVAIAITDSCQGELAAVVCAKETAAIAAACDVEGFYCPVGVIEDKLIGHEFGSANCTGQYAEPCRSGYYCPDTMTEIECGIGHSCRRASSEPKECAMGELSCPRNTLSSHVSTNIAATFFCVFAAFTIASAYLNDYLIKKAMRKTDQIIARANELETEIAVTARENLTSLLSVRSLAETPSETELKLMGSFIVRESRHSSPHLTLQEAYDQEAQRKSRRIPGLKLALKIQKISEVEGPEAVWRAMNRSSRRMPVRSSNHMRSSRRLYTDQYAGNHTSPSDIQIHQFADDLLSGDDDDTMAVELSIPAAEADLRTAAYCRPTSLRVSYQPAPMMAHFQKKGKVQKYEPVAVDDPIDVVFKDLYLNLKLNGRPILRNLCGSLLHGTITALMGPSGCGKTTLLSLLRGQAYFADTSGTLLVNGSRCSSLQSFSKSIAYVSQNDVMYEELTCEENIICAALLFNRRNYMFKKEILPMVYYTLELLGLMLVRRSPVGNEEIKGISGGQKAYLLLLTCYCAIVMLF